MFVKVCGMRETENIRQVAALNPAMMGFIFVSKSPRYAKGVLDPEVLRELPKGISKVAVFVDPSMDEVKEVISAYDIDMLQLHGDESTAFVKEARQLGKKIIKVVAGNREWDVPHMKDMEPYIDYWLIDTRTSVHGGTGKVFDRSVLSGFDFKKPVILSGGLDADEVAAIRSEDYPFVEGVDINSKVEDSPGRKNCEKINKVMTCLN